MERINFQDGQLVKKGYVTIDGVQYEVTEAEYSGETPVSAYVFNKLQDNIEAETDKIVTTTATTTTNGLMSSSDKTKLNGIDTGANKYVLPTASSSTLGGVKTTSGVNSSSGYTACPIISGVPYYKDTNTTYGTATTSANGLMSSADKTKLNGIDTTIQTAKVTTTAAIAENTDYTIPLKYKVGNNSLEIYYMGEKLVKDVHYKEVGTSGATSNKIQFYNWGQAVPKDRTIEFIVRGDYSG